MAKRLTGALADGAVRVLHRVADEGLVNVGRPVPGLVGTDRGTNEWQVGTRAGSVLLAETLVLEGHDARHGVWEVLRGAGDK